MRGSNIHEELALAWSRLQYLEHQRVLRREPDLGRAEERRIIDTHLLDLELQHIDDRIDSICRNASQRAGEVAG